MLLTPVVEREGVRIKDTYEPTREYGTTFGPSPLLRVLLYRPFPSPPSVFNSLPSHPSNAVPMGKAGDH